MSDTPFTDAHEHNVGSLSEPHYVVDSEHVKQLERELAEAKKELEACHSYRFQSQPYYYTHWKELQKELELMRPVVEEAVEKYYDDPDRDKEGSSSANTSKPRKSRD